MLSTVSREDERERWKNEGRRLITDRYTFAQRKRSRTSQKRREWRERESTIRSSNSSFDVGDSPSIDLQHWKAKTMRFGFIDETDGRRRRRSGMADLVRVGVSSRVDVQTYSTILVWQSERDKSTESLLVLRSPLNHQSTRRPKREKWQWRTTERLSLDISLSLLQRTCHTQLRLTFGRSSADERRGSKRRFSF